TGSLAERREKLRNEFDWLRSAVVNEPRGADHIVGALLCEPEDVSCVAGVLFFNNAGYLQMCGHGTIGLVVTLAHLNKIQVGRHRIETPVGVVTAQLHEDNRVTVANVPSYRFAKTVTVVVDGIGPVTGDVAWGGNWFFLVSEHGQELNVKHLRELTDLTIRIKDALAESGITGSDGAEILMVVVLKS
ncbi:MAG: hydroxyproline-2-epimerase, partial [Cytophagaceae bacterium]